MSRRRRRLFFSPFLIPPLTFSDTFDTDVDGWTAGTNTTLAWDAGEMMITNDVQANGYAWIEVAVTPGVAYTASVLNSSATGESEWAVGTAPNTGDIGVSLAIAPATTGTVNFTPSGSSVFLTYGNAFNGVDSQRWADNVSVQPA